MPKHFGESTIDFLIRRKFGRVEHSWEQINKLKSASNATSNAWGKQLENINVQIAAFRKELRSKSSEELATLETGEHQKEEQELFDHAADLDHWSKMADWTLDQAIALSFGRAPEKVQWLTVQPHVGWSPFAFQYSRVRERALSYVRWNQLYDPVLPTIFLAWAKRDGFPVDPELIRRVEARGNIVADWKDLYEKIKQERDQLAQALATIRRDRDSINARLAEANAAHGAITSNRSLGTRERETALKLIIGMAIHGLGYVPSASKSPIPKEIATKLAELGMPLDPDTVRKWLREAAEVLPEQPTDSGSKPNSVSQ